MNGAAFPSLIHYQVALTAILVLVSLNLIANLRMLGRAAPRRKGPTEIKPVSVLIPARNEARNIRRCLKSLLAQDYPLIEIWVLDDGSSDATADIVTEMMEEDSRLRLVRGQPLPQGWMGKSFACHQLAGLAQGDWLLFTDADTDHQPDTLSWAIEAAEQNQADLVSLIPHTATHTLGEQLLLPIIPFGLLGCLPLALGMWRRIPLLMMAVGTFLLFRRESYFRIGGHRAVRGEIAEDVVLARRMCRAGGNVVLLDGLEKMSVHFYHGFRESWHGLAKSLFAVFGYRLLPCLLGMAFYGFLFLWPVALLFTGLWHGRMGEPAIRLALFQFLLNGGLWYAVAVRSRLSRSVALFYPLVVTFIILIMLDSMWQAAVRGIVWKERIYYVREGMPRH